MKGKTYIKLYRSLLNWRWYKDGNTFRLFLHLLLKANIKDSDFENITVKRGEVITGRKQLADDLGMSERNVRTALNHLKSTNEVTSRKTSKFTIISIKNYDLYQQVTNEVTSNRPASDQQVTSNRPHLKNGRKKEWKNYNNARPRAREQKTSFDIDKLEEIK